MSGTCTVCGAGRPDAKGPCPACGAPPGDRANTGVRGACKVCGGVLWSMTETCPGCGAKGYPALRAKFGDRSLKAPDA